MSRLGSISFVISDRNIPSDPNYGPGRLQYWSSDLMDTHYSLSILQVDRAGIEWARDSSGWLKCYSYAPPQALHSLVTMSTWCELNSILGQ